MWGGTSSEAMEDFTGGVTEIFDLARPPVDLATVMTKAVERESLMACSIDVRYVYDLSNSSSTLWVKKVHHRIFVTTSSNTDRLLPRDARSAMRGIAIVSCPSVRLSAVVLRYSAHIKSRKTIKTIKTENITQKHNMTLIVSSQSIAVNK